MRRLIVSMLALGLLLLPDATTQANVQVSPAPHHRNVQIGKASFYHPDLDGRTTASGATFDSRLLTAAHRTLQFGTRVRVTNLVNLRSVIVTINDRGPFVDGRIIDLSRRAAAALGFVQSGVTRVRIEPITVASAL